MDDFKQIRFVWFALVTGVASYTIVVAALLVTGVVALDVYPRRIVNLVAPGVMVYMLAGLVIRRMMLSRLPEGDSDARLAHYRSATLIALALMESGGLLIVTLGMISNSPAWALAGGGAGVAMMLLAKPVAAEAGLDGEA